MSFNITQDLTKEPKPFYVIRDNDETGVSGTGRVLDGIIWASGKVTVNWRTVTPSIATYDSFEEFMNVHINPHPTNNTHVIFGSYYLDHKYKTLKEKEAVLEEIYNQTFNDNSIEVKPEDNKLKLIKNK